MKNYLQTLFKGKRVLILGYGREGKSTLNFLNSIDHKANLTIADKNEGAFVNDTNIKQADVSLISGDDYLNNLQRYDYIIKSPGIALNKIKEHLNPDAVTSQTDIFLAVYGNQVIAVTGTKGKSTTSSLIYHILNKHVPTLFGGNIGLPLFELINDITPETKIVCELSSHQLEYVNHSPHIGILLNLYQEHLDHYDTYFHYQKAKYNITYYQKEADYFIYPADDENINALIEKFPAKGEKLPLFQHDLLTYGIGLKDDSIIVKTRDFTQKVLPLDFKQSLIGKHNRTNAIVAATAATLAGITSDIISEEISSFKALEHRLEFVGLFNEVRYYNDSISTIPEAAIAAIESLKPVDTIILGGFDRGIDYTSLVNYISKSSVSNIVTTGPAGKHIYDLLQKEGLKNSIHYFEKFDDCVHKAIELTPKHGICLLSPAASSYNEFINFEFRGRRFKEIVTTIR